MKRSIAYILLSILCVARSGATEEWTIFQRSKAFSVTQIAIQVGDQVTFVNADEVNHSLYAETPGSEFEILQRPGASFTQHFSQPGVVVVRCAVHPKMKLTIQVEAKKP